MSDDSEQVEACNYEDMAREEMSWKEIRDMAIQKHLPAKNTLRNGMGWVLNTPQPNPTHLYTSG